MSTERLHVTISEELKNCDRLEELADERKLSDWIERAIRRELDREDELDADLVEGVTDDSLESIVREHANRQSHRPDRGWRVYVEDNTYAQLLGEDRAKAVIEDELDKSIRWVGPT